MSPSLVAFQVFANKPTLAAGAAVAGLTGVFSWLTGVFSWLTGVFSWLTFMLTSLLGLVLVTGAAAGVAGAAAGVAGAAGACWACAVVLFTTIGIIDSFWSRLKKWDMSFPAVCVYIGRKTSFLR